MPPQVPIPTPIYRIMHIDCLPTLFARRALHAPNHVPKDGRPYPSIHATDVQVARGHKPVPCGPCGKINDYIGFYFGPLSPMLLRNHTGYGVPRVDQSDIIYLVSTVQSVVDAKLGFVFYNGHSLAAYSRPFADLTSLSEVDWAVVGAKIWKDIPSDMDRQRRKQAEFLVHQAMPWRLVERVGVFGEEVRAKIEGMVSALPADERPELEVRREWYY